MMSMRTVVTAFAAAVTVGAALLAKPCAVRGDDSRPPRTTTAVALDASLPAGFDPVRHMRVAEVKEGMTGYGLSVFRGARPERFQVKVLSILRNFNPKYDVVLIDCHGANLEHTGSIAGMSGSPIYLKDEQGRERMIGAFAYGWPMMKDPVAGVQPIEYMLAIPTDRPATQPSGEVKPKLVGSSAGQSKQRISWSIFDAMAKPVKANALTAISVAGRLGEDPARLQPLATPLMTSGLPPKVLEQFNQLVGASGLVALQAGGVSGGNGAGDGPPPKLEPGAVLAVPLLTGDSEMTAIGTVTDVISTPGGDRVVGFGHSFNNEGPVALPMGTGRINAVIANLATSFKIGALADTTGTIVADQTVGVGGRIGSPPPMAPLDLKITYTDGSADEHYHFDVALHPKLTPMLAAAAVGAAISGTHDLPQFHTIDYDLNLEFSNGQALRLANTAVDVQVQDLLTELGLPIVAAGENPFEKVALAKMSGTVKVSPEAREARILSVALPRLKYQPGETAKLYLSYRPFRGGEAMMPVEFDLPRELPDGQYQFVITDWQQYLESEKLIRPFRFTAESGGEMFAALKDLMSIRHNAVYLQLLRKADGVAIGRTAMPHLPSSRRQVMMDAGLSNTTAFVSSTLKVIPTDLIMDGSANFTLTIDREAKVDTGQPKPAKHPGAAAPPRPDDVKPKPGAKPEPPTGTDTTQPSK
jgi:hypothetical protein